MVVLEPLAGLPDGPRVYRVRTPDGHAVEVVDSTQASEAKERRVLGLSTLLGCPVKCAVCDAGGGYMGRLTAVELLSHLDAVVSEAFPGGLPTVPELRVELTRMGEPTFNQGVLQFLTALPHRYPPARVTVLLSTVGPARSERFLEELLAVKAQHFGSGGLTLQLSLFTTDEALRKQMVPIKAMSFEALSAYGTRFVETGTVRVKVWLNFPAARELPVEAERLAVLFSPEVFAVKLSPINLSAAAVKSGFTSLSEDPAQTRGLVEQLVARGYEVKVTDAEGRDDPTGCGHFTSAGLSPTVPRRVIRGGA